MLAFDLQSLQQPPGHVESLTTTSAGSPSWEGGVESDSKPKWVSGD